MGVKIKGWQSLPPAPGVVPNHWFQSTWTRGVVFLPSAGMEMSLVMHLPMLAVPDSPGHPCFAHFCHLLPPLHPSLSLCSPTSSLHCPPSASPLSPPSDTKTKLTGGYNRTSVKLFGHDAVLPFVSCEQLKLLWSLPKCFFSDKK